MHAARLVLFWSLNPISGGVLEGDVIKVGNWHQPNPFLTWRRPFSLLYLLNQARLGVDLAYNNPTFFNQSSDSSVTSTEKRRTKYSLFYYPAGSWNGIYY